MEPKITAPLEGRRFVTLAAVLILCLAGTAIYANSLHGRFIWDDVNFIERNALIRDWSHLGRIFLADPGESSGIRYGFYRPLQTLTYMANYSLGGLDVMWYHATNLLLHLASTLVLAWFVAVLCGNRPLGWVTALLYLCHPVHTEAVSYLSGRADSLALLFMLLSLTGYVRHLQTGRPARVWPAGLFFLLALLAKETAVVLPALLLLCHLVLRRRIVWQRFLAFPALAVVYFLARLFLLEEASLNAAEATTALQRVPGLFVAITKYVSLLLLPRNLHFVYGDLLFEMRHPLALTGAVLTGGLLLAALRLRREKPLFFFAVFWFFLTLLPVSNLYRTTYFMAEHYLYVPAIAFSLLIARGILGIARRNGTAAGLLLLGLVIVYGALTVQQNRYWQEPIAFFERTLARGAPSVKVYNNLGGLYRDQGRYDRAIALYEQAAAMDPTDYTAPLNLGMTYTLLGKPGPAVPLLRQALRLDPSVPQIHNNLGYAYALLNRFAEAIPFFENAVRMNPHEPQYHVNLALAHVGIGQGDRAVALLEQAIARIPQGAELHYRLARIHADRGEGREAAEHDAAARRLGRSEP